MSGSRAATVAEAFVFPWTVLMRFRSFRIDRQMCKTNFWTRRHSGFRAKGTRKAFEVQGTNIFGSMHATILSAVAPVLYKATIWKAGYYNRQIDFLDPCMR